LSKEQFKKPLKFEFGKQNGHFLLCEDHDHFDYIEDVLCEHFDVEYEFCVRPDLGPNKMFFGNQANAKRIQEALEAINLHHQTEPELFNTIPY